MIDAKVNYLFDTNNWRLARMFSSGERDWCLRGSSIEETRVPGPKLQDFKDQLRWDALIDGLESPWEDRTNTSILAYAVIANKVDTVKEILKLYEDKSDHLVHWVFPRDGVLEFGLPGYSSILHVAMMLSDVEIVTELLCKGAKAESMDIMGNDPLMMACAFNRLNNIKLWFEKYPDWNVDRQNGRYGSTALHFAVYLGPKKLDTIQYLVEKKNADVNVRNKSGTSALILACSNEDADPEVVRYILKQGIDIHRQIKSQSITWKMLRGAARLLVRLKLSSSTLLRRVAESSGLTALHYAARRGDVEIVELLMEHGANPSTKNDMGRDVLSYCEAFPEIQLVCWNAKSLFLSLTHTQTHTHTHARAYNTHSTHSRTRHAHSNRPSEE
ncbi:ankyrin repeat domain-containing protein [bacterium]|nr:ankyrin repeat domain-containing protein [bacterium]